MTGKAVHQLPAVEAVADDAVHKHHHVGHLVLQAQVHQLEVVVARKDVEVAHHLVVTERAAAEADALVEDGEGVAHAAVGLLRNQGQRLLVVGHAFFLGHHLQVCHGVAHVHALEVVNLAP